MRTRAIQLLTLVLCITLGGGAQACLCTRVVHGPSERPKAHACCPSDSSPTPRERCYECELVAAVPMASTTVPVRECPLLMTSPAAVNAGATDPAASHSAIDDHSVFRPQLCDLHHLFTQLTE